MRFISKNIEELWTKKKPNMFSKLGFYGFMFKSFFSLKKKKKGRVTVAPPHLPSSSSSSAS